MGYGNKRKNEGAYVIDECHKRNLLWFADWSSEYYARDQWWHFGSFYGSI